MILAAVTTGDLGRVTSAIETARARGTLESDLEDTFPNGSNPIRRAVEICEFGQDGTDAFAEGLPGAAAAVAITDALLKAGADPNSSVKIDSFHGMTALHLAAGRGCAKLIVMLLAAGANPKVILTRPEGTTRTPLQMAESGGYEDAAALLRATISDDAASPDLESRE